MNTQPLFSSNFVVCEPIRLDDKRRFWRFARRLATHFQSTMTNLLQSALFYEMLLHNIESSIIHKMEGVLKSVVRNNQLEIFIRFKIQKVCKNLQLWTFVCTVLSTNVRTYVRSVAVFDIFWTDNLRIPMYMRDYSTSVLASSRKLYSVIVTSRP